MTKVTSVLRLHYKMDVFLINISLELSYAHPPIEIELTHSGECGLFFIKPSSSPDLYSIIVLSLLFEGMCCYE